MHFVSKFIIITQCIFCFIEENDCDVVSTGMTQSLLDPFTKLQITDPVKNRRCGHSYEKDTILELLKKHKQMR